MRSYAYNLTLTQNTPAPGIVTSHGELCVVDLCVETIAVS